MTRKHFHISEKNIPRLEIMSHETGVSMADIVNTSIELLWSVIGPPQAHQGPTIGPPFETVNCLLTNDEKSSCEKNSVSDLQSDALYIDYINIKRLLRLLEQDTINKSNLKYSFLRLLNIVKEQIPPSHPCDYMQGFPFVKPKKADGAQAPSITSEKNASGAHSDHVPLEKAIDHTKKKSKIDYSTPDAILDYLNFKTGLNYQKTKNARNAILKLLSQVSIDEVKAVIDYKHEKWKGTDYEQYLRPSTLFRESKFFEYLAQAQKAKPKQPTTKNRNAISIMERFENGN